MSLEYIPVHALVVTLAANNFRRKVIWRTAQRPRNVWHLLGKSEIGDLNVTVSVK